MTDYTDKKVAVIGLGVEGVAITKFLVDKGAIVTILDHNTQDKLTQDFYFAVKKLGVTFILGETYLDGLSDFDIIVRSPGVRRFHPKLIDASQKGIVITSLTQIFMELCPCQIIGVTGTKGKGTTSTLIYEMLKKAGKDAYLGGNIGLPPITFLDKLTKDSIVVLEMSSFQLQDLTLSPHIAVMLMVTSEHLDYHGDTLEYVMAKRNILSHQSTDDIAILNRDYPASLESDIYTDGAVYFVTREGEVSQGAFLKDEAVYLRNNGEDIKIIDYDQILLPGKHNLENVCAASMAAYLSGVSVQDIGIVLHTFKGLEHRLELVAETNGVKWYDDSFSTTPETAIAAIEAFSSPEILILGGSPKGSDFTELGQIIGKASNIKAIIGIGVEWERMKSQFPTSNFQFPIVEGAEDMATIVKAAEKIATPGDVVLLSPACASFGMFKNYKDRGAQFKRIVQTL
jgi:UDP-N-acetylmuramoylalanine--D-glutamate ligase